MNDIKTGLPSSPPILCVQHHAALFGVEGQGGLASEVEEMKQKIDTVERRLESLNAKWLFLVFIAATLGGSASSGLVKLLTTLHFIR